MKKLVKIIISVIIILIIIWGIWYSVAKPKEQGVVKVGVILPLSGKAASMGEDMQRAINLALGNINKNKKIIEIFYEDEKCDAREAVTAYQGLRLRGISIIIGAVCSPSTLAIAPLAQEDGVIVVTPASGADSISQAGDFIFRNHIFASQKTGKLGEFAGKIFENASTIYDQTNDAFILGEQVFVNKFQGNILNRETFQKNAMDFSPQLTKIKEKKPEAVFIGGIMPEGALIVKKMKEFGIPAKIFIDDSLATDKSFIDVLGSFSEGIIFAGSEFSRETNSEFWDMYTERFRENPNIFSAQAYDSLMILADIIKRECKGGNSICIKDNLYNVKNYFGASGLTTFDENGDAVKQVIIKIIKDGQFIPYNE